MSTWILVALICAKDGACMGSYVRPFTSEAACFEALYKVLDTGERKPDVFYTCVEITPRTPPASP